MSENIKSLKLIVTGKVQGVFYRKNTQQKAKEFNLVGWVKNNTNGTVEIFIQGHQTDIQKMIDWCWQGPKNAAVSHIEIEESLPKNYSEFNVIR